MQNHDDPDFGEGGFGGFPDEPDDDQEPVNYAEQAQAMSEALDMGNMPQMDSLPPQSETWLLVPFLAHICEKLNQEPEQKPVAANAELSNDAIERMAEAIAEKLGEAEDEDEEKNPREELADKAAKFLPSILLTACLLLFGWSALQKMPVRDGLPESLRNSNLVGVFEDMAYCRGQHFTMRDGYCTFRPVLQNGQLITPGWKPLQSEAESKKQKRDDPFFPLK